MSKIHKTFQLFNMALLPALLGVLACGAGGDNRSEACDSIGWRQATPGTIVCPGADSCSCSGSDICCVTGDSRGQIDDSYCAPLTQCQDLALTCDGPEDCGSDEVCCLGGLDSTCMPESDCFGLSTAPACRGADDCDGIDECTPSDIGPFSGTIAACL